jgi:uncharacterized protein (TIGR02145 family)
MKTILYFFLAFSTLISCQTNQSQTIKDIDGNIYHTVKIGTQTWTVENLKVTKYRDGTPIPVLNDRNLWINDSVGACCYYNNDPANGKIYGLLYNGPAILNPKKIAPKGWHIPSDKEWQILINYLGGEKVAGGKLKEKGNAHWMENVDATNQSGFTALPAGLRDCNIQVTAKYNSFDWLGLRTLFASSTEWGNTIVWVYDLQNLNGSVFRKHGGGCGGISVRCVKD